MKKVLSLILCLVLVLSLAACGGAESTVNQNPDGSGTQSGEEGNASNSSDSTQAGDSQSGDGSTSNSTQGGNSVTGTQAQPVDGTALYQRVLAALGNPTVSTQTGSAKDYNSHVVTLADSGVLMRYIGIKALKSGDEVNIMQATDFHFNKMNERDNTEQNPAVMDTRKNRKAYSDEATVPNVKKVLELGKRFDAVAITGDIMDYLTWGSLDLVKTHIWDVLGDKALAVLGGHDTTRVMQGTVGDSTTAQSRYDIIQSYWKHDVSYSNKIVKDRVMMVNIDNGASKYYGDQAKKLAADIKYARENNLVILIFQHEPLATKNAAYGKTYPLTGSSKTVNFYKNCIGGSKYSADAVTKEVLELITKNADVIRGVFCGHLHDGYYVEIDATYEKNGETVKTSIPQIVLGSSADYRCITVINVE